MELVSNNKVTIVCCVTDFTVSTTVGNYPPYLGLNLDQLN